MTGWVAILFCVLLSGIVWYDFMDRSIPLLLLVSAIGLVMFSFYIRDIVGYEKTIGINLLLLLLNIGLLVTWFKIRKNNLSFFKDVFGLGDLLMLVLGAFFFNPVNYLLFIMISALVGLFYGLILKLTSGEIKRGIPFAGIVGVLLIINQLSNLLGYNF